jgi:predicted ATPase
MTNMHVLVGIHTAGKTSLGRELERRGFRFFPELAVEMIGNQRPWQLPASFDISLAGKELQRDDVLRGVRAPFFVETWHLGNLAYARTRGSVIPEIYENRIRAHVKEFEPRVYFLDLPPQVMPSRTAYFTSDPDRSDAVAFFGRVRTEFLKVFDLFSIAPIVIAACDAPQTLVRSVAAHEATHGCLRRMTYVAPPAPLTAPAQS